MTPYADQTFKALLKKYLDDSIESCGSAASLGAWIPTGIDANTEDWELTDEHVKEWLMLEMNDIVDHYLETAPIYDDIDCHPDYNAQTDSIEAVDYEREKV